MNHFLVETPHQVLNALEARERFALSSVSVTIITSTNYTRPVYEPILHEYKWASLSYIEPWNWAAGLKRSGIFRSIILRAGVFFEDLRRRQLLDGLAQRLPKADNLFLGNYGKLYMRRFAEQIQCKTIYVLDDGTATLSLNEERHRLRSQPGSLRPTRAMYRLRNRLVGVDERHLDRVTFFTTYDLEAAEGDAVIKNDYRYLRSVASQHAPSDEVFFLGQPMVEDGLLTDEVFTGYMAKVVRHFEHSKLIYLPHKRECEEKTRKLEQRFGLSIRRFDVPIEYEMSVRGTRPRALASFFSSALENSRIIFGSLMPIHCFRIQTEDFLYRREEIAQIYSHFARRQDPSFEVVDLCQENERHKVIELAGSNTPIIQAVLRNR